MLGRAHADVVIASAMFMEPSLLSDGWNTAPETADPAQAAEGFDPLMAMLCSPGGQAILPTFGWHEPYPEPTEADKAGRRATEETTNELSVHTLSAVTDAELEEFVSLTAGIAESAV